MLPATATINKHQRCYMLL